MVGWLVGFRWSCYVDQAGLLFPVILLPLTSHSYRHVPPCCNNLNEAGISLWTYHGVILIIIMCYLRVNLFFIFGKYCCYLSLNTHIHTHTHTKELSNHHLDQWFSNLGTWSMTRRVCWHIDYVRLCWKHALLARSPVGEYMMLFQGPHFWVTDLSRNLELSYLSRCFNYRVLTWHRFFH